MTLGFSKTERGARKQCAPKAVVTAVNPILSGGHAEIQVRGAEIKPARPDRVFALRFDRAVSTLPVLNFDRQRRMIGLCREYDQSEQPCLPPPTSRLSRLTH